MDKLTFWLCLEWQQYIELKEVKRKNTFPEGLGQKGGGENQG